MIYWVLNLPQWIIKQRSESFMNSKPGKSILFHINFKTFECTKSLHKNLSALGMAAASTVVVLPISLPAIHIRVSIRRLLFQWNNNEDYPLWWHNSPEGSSYDRQIFFWSFKKWFKNFLGFLLSILALSLGNNTSKFQ